MNNRRQRDLVPWQDNQRAAPVSDADREAEKLARETLGRDFRDAAALGAVYRNTQGVELEVSSGGLLLTATEAAKRGWKPGCRPYGEFSVSDLRRISSAMTFRRPPQDDEIREVSWAEYLAMVDRGEVRDRHGEPMTSARVAKACGFRGLSFQDEPNKGQDRPNYGQK